MSLKIFDIALEMVIPTVCDIIVQSKEAIRIDLALLSFRYQVRTSFDGVAGWAIESSRRPIDSFSSKICVNLMDQIE